VLIGNEIIIVDWGMLILKVLLMALKRVLWTIHAMRFFLLEFYVLV